MPIITPTTPAVATSRTPDPQSLASRARAVAAFNAAATSSPTPPQSQQHPVSNPTQVSPEEMSAIAPKASTAEKQVQSDSTETSSEEPKAATTPAKEEPTLSSQYAVLARKEKALRAKVQSQELAIRSKEAAIAEREAAIKAKEAEYQTNYIPKSKLSDDTLATLLEAGITYDQITQMALNQSQAQDPATKLAIQRLEAQVKAQAEAVENAKKQQEDSVKNQYSEALKQIRYDATALVKTDNSFEMIRETNSIGDVVDLIERTYKEDGVILTVEEAAQLVEDELVEQVSKYARVSKIQQRLQPKPPKEAEAPKSPVQQSNSQQSQLKTLTNAVGSTRPLTARERALLAFENKLNK